MVMTKTQNGRYIQKPGFVLKIAILVIRECLVFSV